MTELDEAEKRFVKWTGLILFMIAFIGFLLLLFPPTFLAGLILVSLVGGTLVGAGIGCGFGSLLADSERDLYISNYNKLTPVRDAPVPISKPGGDRSVHRVSDSDSLRENSTSNIPGENAHSSIK